MACSTSPLKICPGRDRGKYWDSKDIFWYFSHTILKTASYIFQGHRPVDGIIHVTAFGCGPDFLVNRLLEGEAKKHDLPFLTLTIDEQSGQSGVLTRLEAFCDMVRRRQRQRRVLPVRKVSFPSMGTRQLLPHLIGLKQRSVSAKPTETLSLGTRYAPEFACVPYKIVWHIRKS